MISMIGSICYIGIMNLSLSSAIRITALSLFFSSLAQANSRLAEVKQRVTSPLTKALARHDLKLGDSVFLRAFKHEKEMEVWMKPAGKQQYKLFKTYRIAGNSGVLGPKLAEGDRQMPEGFYEVKKSALNPNSRYHLSFNIGYPNSYDRYHKRTGSFIMVHGSNVSIGCYAMTDAGIEEIYLLVEAALQNGQKTVPFHTYPFRFQQGWKKQVGQNHQCATFWSELEPAYHHFNTHHTPAKVAHAKGKYVITRK